MGIIEERFDLIFDRLDSVDLENEIPANYVEFAKECIDFIYLMKESVEKVNDGFFKSASIDEIRDINHRTYKAVLPENYETSYANPAYAASKLGLKMGQMLSFLYTELRSMVPFVYEGLLEEVVIRMELFMEVFQTLVFAKEEGMENPQEKDVKETLYWFVSDYSETSMQHRVRTQLDSSCDFAVRIACDSDYSDLRYLYQYGEYVSENTERLAKFINNLPEEKINLIADTYTEGYRIGFVKSGTDLSTLSVVGIRYILGFERVIKKAVSNFEKMGLKATAQRACNTIFYKSGSRKNGYYGAIPNKQYEYDHKDDMGLFLDKKLAKRRLEVMREAYEEVKELAPLYAGPAVIEEFGDVPFAPVAKEEVVSLNDEQQKLAVELANQTTQVTYEYLDGEKISFTIIAFPVPQIGEKFEEIFDETIKINTLDYHTYEKMQAIIIDTLNKSKYVEVKGMNGNKTDIRIELYPISNPDKEAIFENCVADVNIPVGEVFTSPVLEGTKGRLHVSKVFLNDLEYQNLEMTFEDGKIATYTCTNFDDEEKNKEYVKSNILHHHDTLPIGEFAIGTNTTAYMTAKKYDIGNRFPILIAEKTGPHFAVGDTCYSHSEDVKVYNEDGKEIVAKDNSISILRKTDPSKAYFGCHTDITIPYDELGSIIAYSKQGDAYPIIENGRFILPGLSELNAPFDM